MNRLTVTCIALAIVVSTGDSQASSAYEEMDIAALQTLMEQGTLTSESLLQFYLDRIETLDRDGPTLNSIIEINPDALDIARSLDKERAKSGPRGKLHGIPVILKANIDTGDKMQTTAGALAMAGHYASDDAFLVAQLRAAGAIIFGKANLSEWANFMSTKSTSGWSALGGQTQNAYESARNPCGSSSGSAVSVAAGLVTVSIGTETDGSVVCPASINGVVGIKPSLGWVSRTGIIPLAHSQDTAGPMGRSVTDAAVLLNAMVGRDDLDAMAKQAPPVPDFAADLDPSALAGARIGVIRNYSGQGRDPRVDAVFEQSVEKMRALGAEVIDSIKIETEGMGDAEYEVLLYEFKADLNSYLANTNAPVKSLADVIRFNKENAAQAMPVFQQEILEAAQAKGTLEDSEYLEALVKSKRIAQEGIDGALKAHNLDALIAPTNGPAWMTDHVNGDHFSGISSSAYAAVSGYPSVTVPSGRVVDLPVGLSFFGGNFSDARLIRYAYAFEQATKARQVPSYEE